jgi:hypothetical protein
VNHRFFMPLTKMPTDLRLAVLGLVALTSSTACSLTGVADYKGWECKSDAECRAAFNEGNGYYPDCAAFSCEERGDRRECVRIAQEICDGLDNDCDRLVDETADGKANLGVSRRKVLNLSEAPLRASIASSEAFGAYAYVTDSAGAQLLPLEKGEARAITHRTTPPDSDGSQYTTSELAQLSSGCYTPASCDFGDSACEGSLNLAFNTSQAVCALSDIGATSAEDFGLFAGIRTNGCSAGELRVGHMDSDAPDQLVTRGRGQRNPVYRGVATRGSRCSSNKTEACDALKQAVLDGSGSTADLPDVCGVSHPTVAATGDRGLVAYLGQPATESTCGEKTPVLGLGLELKTSATLGTALDPSGDGEPDILGETDGGAPPAVYGVDERGFVVAFGASGGGVDVMWVPLPESRPNTPLALEFPGYETRTDGASAALSGVTRIHHIDTGIAADAIHVAELEGDEGAVTLALAWLEGCAAQDPLDTAAPVRSVILRIDVESDVPVVESINEPVELGESNRPPIVIPSAAPFVVEGFRRGALKATSETLGGYFVVAQDKTRPRAYRIAAFDGLILDATENLLLERTEKYFTALGPSSLLAFESDSSELREVTLECAE